MSAYRRTLAGAASREYLHLLLVSSMHSPVTPDQEAARINTRSRLYVPLQVLRVLIGGNSQKEFLEVVSD